MRASSSSTSDRMNGQLVGGPAVERAMQAALLLREAFALLDVESESSWALVPKHPSDRLLRLPEGERLTGLRRSAIYEQMQRGTFPRSVKAGPRAATWSDAAIQRGDRGSV